MNGTFMVGVWLYVGVSFRLCSPWINPTPEAQIRQPLKYLGELEATPPEELCHSPRDSQVGSSAFGTRRKRQSVCNVLFPHQRFGSFFPMRLDRDQVRSQKVGGGFLQPLPQPAASSGDGSASSSLLLPGQKEKGSVSVLPANVIENEPSWENAQAVRATSRGLAMKNNPWQAQVHAEKASGLQDCGPIVRASTEEEMDIDQYISSTLDLQAIQPTPASDSALAAVVGATQEMQMSPFPSVVTPGTYEPSESFTFENDPELVNIEDKFIAMYPSESPNEMRSVKAWVYSILSRGMSTHMLPHPNGRNVLRHNSPPQDQAAYGLNLLILSIKPFASYINGANRGRQLPSFDQVRRQTYSRLVHEIGIQAGLRRTRLLELLPAARRIFQAIHGSVEDWYRSTNIPNPRDPMRWMNVIERCTYLVINYLVLYEYVTTPFEVQHLRDTVGTFLLHSHNVWTFYFQVTMHQKDVELIPGFAQSLEVSTVLLEESSCATLLFSTWCCKGKSSVFGFPTSRRAKFGLLKMLDDCAFVEWLQSKKKSLNEDK